MNADDWPESAIRGLNVMCDRGEITDVEHQSAINHIRNEYGPSEISEQERD